MNCVVIVQQGLGDVVMALPMLRKVDDHLPQGSTIHAVVGQGIQESLIRLMEWKNEFRFWNIGNSRDARAIAGVGRLAWQLRQYRPDILLVPQSTNGLPAALIARAIGARISVGPAGGWSALGFNREVAQRDDAHKSEHFAEFAYRAGLGAPSEPLRYPALRESELEAASKNAAFGDGPWITISPTAKTSLHKRWAPEKYREAIARLSVELPQHKFAIMGGPDERDYLSACGDETERVRIFAGTSLAQSLLLLRRSACHLSGCTGTIHLAALAGTPMVALYGPTNPDFTGPFGADYILLRLGLSCSPCYRNGFEGGCGTPICMSGIDVDEVVAAVKSVVGGGCGKSRVRISNVAGRGPSAADAAIKRCLPW